MPRQAASNAGARTTRLPICSGVFVKNLVVLRCLSFHAAVLGAPEIATAADY